MQKFASSGPGLPMSSKNHIVDGGGTRNSNNGMNTGLSQVVRDEMDDFDFLMNESFERKQR